MQVEFKLSHLVHLLSKSFEVLKSFFFTRLYPIVKLLLKKFYTVVYNLNINSQKDCSIRFSFPKKKKIPPDTSQKPQIDRKKIHYLFEGKTT